MSDEEPDYMATYRDFWADLVETDGQLDLDKVARELSDYRVLMDNASEVYDALANLSKPNTSAHAVISEAYSRREAAIEEATKEAEAERDEALARTARLEQSYNEVFAELSTSLPVVEAARRLVEEWRYHPQEGSDAEASNQAMYEALEEAVLAWLDRGPEAKR